MKITGRVQGIFFRHSARIRAEKLGIVGTAQNNPDGSLEIIAEGKQPELEQLIEWCRHGPPLARVGEIEITWERANGEFKAFTIL